MKVDREKADLPTKNGFEVGDIVSGDFECDSVLTFIVASESYQDSLKGNGPEFHKNHIAIVIDIIDTRESFFSMEFCKILFQGYKIGWLPKEWLKKIS